MRSPIGMAARSKRSGATTSLIFFNSAGTTNFAMPASMLALYLPLGSKGSSMLTMRKFCTTPPERVRTASAKPSARMEAEVWFVVTSMPRRARIVAMSTAAPLTCMIAMLIASATASDALPP